MAYTYLDEIDNINERNKLAWRKAAASNPSGNCFEVAKLSDGTIAVRDSKNPEGAVLRYTKPEITAFLDGAKKGEFDDLV